MDKSIPEMENDLFPTDYCKLLFTNQWNFLQTMIFELSALLYIQQGNSVLCDTNYNHTHICYRNRCCPFPKLLEQTNQLKVQGVQ